MEIVQSKEMKIRSEVQKAALNIYSIYEINLWSINRKNKFALRKFLFGSC